jgi:hypothetical protein
MNGFLRLCSACLGWVLPGCSTARRRGAGEGYSALQIPNQEQLSGVLVWRETAKATSHGSQPLSPLPPISPLPALPPLFPPFFVFFFFLRCVSIVPSLFYLGTKNGKPEGNQNLNLKGE